MPRQLVFLQVPEPLSIVEFDTNQGEEIFLTYTWEREKGPPLIRHGQGSPYMELIGGGPEEFTTHPCGLRLGTWLIHEEERLKTIEKAEKLLKVEHGNSPPSEVIEIVQRATRELKTVKSHDVVFKRKYKDYDLLGQQGCGDLTMNYWNVAFVNNALKASKAKPPSLVYLPHEHLEVNTYSCIVKWKRSENREQRVGIEAVKFQRPESTVESNQIVWVRFGDTWLPRGDSIELAVSGRQVVRDGRVVPVVSICHQFSDLRHLIQMANINPKTPLYRSEAPGRDGVYGVREYFGNLKDGSIWFGEKAFLDDETRNLLRAALSSPVMLEFTPGANEDILRGALTQAGYYEVRNLQEPLSPGSWRLVPRSKLVNLIEIYFKRNTYGWTMIGVTRDNSQILCLACKGTPGKSGYTLEQAAEILLQAGAWNALLIDEGDDVFQRVRLEGNALVELIPLKQSRLRAVFIFARRNEPNPTSRDRTRH